MDMRRTRLISLAFLVGLTALVATAMGKPAPGTAVPGQVHALAFDAGARALWLGGRTGLYRSHDAGRTWSSTALRRQGPAPDVRAVAPHPVDPAVLYVGTHGSGVLKTTDGGRTWRQAGAGLGGLDVPGLAIDPNTPDKLHAFVRGKGGGIYRTTDAGRAWERVDDGPAADTTVLISVNLPAAKDGIFLYAGTAAGLQRNSDCF
jgi:photosystem II stability/assembly factor-like uncharacterized protein